MSTSLLKVVVEENTGDFRKTCGLSPIELRYVNGSILVAVMVDNGSGTQALADMIAAAVNEQPDMVSREALHAAFRDKDDALAKCYTCRDALQRILRCPEAEIVHAVAKAALKAS